MPAHILVMGAGTAGAENVIRSLRAADPSLVLSGCHEDRFALRNSAADGRYLTSPPGTPALIAALRGLVRDRRVDVILPTTDRHVTALSEGRHLLRGRVFLPRGSTIALCRDKYRLISALRQRGIAAPATYVVRDVDRVEAIFARLGRPGQAWCRPRTGTCARGGAAVASADEARRWIALWKSMQGVPVSAFTLAEFLPGREILCQSVWDRGRMVLANTFERLAYFGADNIPSGVTSLSSLAKTVVEPAALDVCRAAVAAVDPEASGAFSIDIKEDANGRPHVTEINAGRFFMAMTAFDRVLKHSMTLAWVRLALGEPVDFGEPYDAVDDYYMVRDMDLEPGIFHADEFFEDVQDASGGARGRRRPGRPTRS